MIEFPKDASRVSNLFLKLNFKDNSRDHPERQRHLQSWGGGRSLRFGSTFPRACHQARLRLDLRADGDDDDSLPPPLSF